jgi:hypothetical protein
MWIPISEDPPHGVEVMLWLGPEVGGETPIGCIIATYKDTPMGECWCVKTLNGDINTGIRASLITHYQLLEGGEPDERPIC